jgi:hypothetical protein
VNDAVKGSADLVRRTLLMPRWKAIVVKLLIKVRNLRNRILRRGSH